MSLPIPIDLAVEDDLSEHLMRRLLLTQPSEFAVGRVFKGNGFGELRRRVHAFNNMARSHPVLLLTDLDQKPCASELMADWLKKPRHPDFLLRVAVREVEAWILASDVSLSRFFALRSRFECEGPELLTDPKLELLKLAVKIRRRDLRDALVRRDASGNLRQGPAYNSTLARFLTDCWELDVAASKCRSLDRLLKSLAALAARWPARQTPEHD